MDKLSQLPPEFKIFKKTLSAQFHLDGMSYTIGKSITAGRNNSDVMSEHLSRCRDVTSMTLNRVVVNFQIYFAHAK